MRHEVFRCDKFLTVFGADKLPINVAKSSLPRRDARGGDLAGESKGEGEFLDSNAVKRAVGASDHPAFRMREGEGGGSDDAFAPPKGFLREVRVNGKGGVSRLGTAVGGEGVNREGREG